VFSSKRCSTNIFTKRKKSVKIKFKIIKTKHRKTSNTNLQIDIMKQFIFVFIILLIALSTLSNVEAYPGGFCCKTFNEEEQQATPVAKEIPLPTE
ncbi:4990_t:CDS:1, partial [Dentiscutata heterogama]